MQIHKTIFHQKVFEANASMISFLKALTLFPLQSITVTVVMI